MKFGTKFLEKTYIRRQKKLLQKFEPQIPTALRNKVDENPRKTSRRGSAWGPLQVYFAVLSGSNNLFTTPLKILFETRSIMWWWWWYIFGGLVREALEVSLIRCVFAQAFVAKYPFGNLPNITLNDTKYTLN